MLELITSLSSTELIDDGINNVLCKVGEYTCADRAYVFEINEDYTTTNTYEWCKEGVTPQIDNLKGIPFESMPNWIHLFLQGENILIEELEEKARIIAGQTLKEALHGITLEELLDKRDAIRKEEILSAVVKNEWQSYEEIMNFLNVGSDGEKKEK